jgi:hypothetical protein
VACLGVQRERLAAGGEHRQCWTGAQQRADERRGCEHVLEVVSDEQQVLGGEEALSRLVGRLAGERRRQRAVAPRVRRRPRPVGKSAGRGGWGVDPRVVGEDRLVQVVQLSARLDPELLDEDLPRVTVRLQRVGLAAASIQREHPLRVQSLTPRALGGELLELADQFGVAPRSKVGIDAHLKRREMLFFSARDLRRRERCGREVGERRSAPQRQRLPQLRGRVFAPPGRQRPAAVGDQALEALGVELTRTDA